MTEPNSLATPPGGDWLTTFTVGSATHAVVLLVSLSAMTCLLVAGWRTADAPKQRRSLLRWWGVGILVAQTIHFLWWCMPERISWQNTLRLHVCDLAAPLAAVVCFSAARWPRTMLFYWGLGMSAFAFFTPVLKHGPAHPIFWMFWVNHIQIVGTALFDLIVAGYRPDWRDWRLAVGVSLAYVALVFPLNLAIGANIGFVGPQGGAAPIDALGPWPWRAIALILVVSSFMALLTWLVRVLAVRGDARPKAG